MALVVIAILFALGGFSGCLLAFRLEGGGMDALGDYLNVFLETAKQGGLRDPSLWELLWRVFRWPLLVLLFGFTALGLLAVPALSALRGFFLSFSIAAFARAYGAPGLRLAFFLMGISGAATLPAFFVLSVQSLIAAGRLAAASSGQGRRGLPYDSDYFLRCGVCAAALGIGIFLERFLVPAWISEAAGALLAGQGF